MTNNILSDEKMKVIEIVLDMFPQLKKNKTDIINTVYGKLVKPYNYIFTKIFIDNREFYIDPNNAIYNKQLNFKGFITDNKIYLIDDINNEIIKESEENKKLIIS